MYLTHTRPDLMFAVSLISRFMQRPSKHHLGAAKRILRYVQGTLDFGISYAKDENLELVAYTDSDWAGSADDRKSTTGFIFCLSGGAVSWMSKKQGVTALSSTEAEYIAATSTACHAVWMRRILQDLKYKQMQPTTIFCDNKSTIDLSKNPVHQGRTKHIEIRYHFIRELISKEEVELQHCSTEDQPADMLRKALNESKIQKLRNLVGVMSLA